MADLGRAACIDDLRAIARRRLPGFAFDFIDGGADNERNLNRNQQAFSEIEMMGRALIDVSNIETETEIFGERYAVPFGKSPIGFLNMAWPDADLMVARMAACRNVPVGISTASSTPLETLAETAEGNAWFQIYVSEDRSLVESLLSRAWAAGCRILMVTIDAAVPGKRDRDVRNGLQFPFKMTPELLFDLMRHPAWSLATLQAGPPGFANFTMDGGNSLSLIDIQKRMISDAFTWDGLKHIRDLWKGPLVLKGVVHPDDAVRAVKEGCDGLLVSNHGGRQMSFGPAAIDLLPAIAAAINKSVPILFDSGIRRGADIVRAKALGADFMLSGRCFAYGAAAGGAAGCGRAFDILELEMRRTLGQLGCTNFKEIDERVLAKNVLLKN